MSQDIDQRDLYFNKAERIVAYAKQQAQERLEIERGRTQFDRVEFEVLEQEEF